MPGRGLKIPDIAPMRTVALPQMQHSDQKLVLNIYHLGNQHGFGISYNDAETGQLTPDEFMVDNFSTPWPTEGDAMLAGLAAHVRGGDCTGFSELDPEDFGLPVLEPKMPKLADDLSPSRTRLISRIMLALCEDSASRSDGECVVDAVGHLLVPGFDRDAAIRLVDTVYADPDGVDADIAVYVALQKGGFVPERIR